MPAGRRRTMGQGEATGPTAAGSPGPMREFRRGWSSLHSPVRVVPAVEGLFRRVRHVAVPAPGIEAVVDDEARQMSERHIGRRPRQQLAGSLHRGFFGKWHLVLLHQLAPPRVDLLVYVDLHRADIAATAVER